jgi:hypothetical protein
MTRGSEMESQAESQAQQQETQQVQAKVIHTKAHTTAILLVHHSGSELYYGRIYKWVINDKTYISVRLKKEITDMTPIEFLRRYKLPTAIIIGKERSNTGLHKVIYPEPLIKTVNNVRYLGYYQVVTYHDFDELSYEAKPKIPNDDYSYIVYSEYRLPSEYKYIMWIVGGDAISGILYLEQVDELAGTIYVEKSTETLRQGHLKIYRANVSGDELPHRSSLRLFDHVIEALIQGISFRNYAVMCSDLDNLLIQHPEHPTIKLEPGCYFLEHEPD